VALNLLRRLVAALPGLFVPSSFVELAALPPDQRTTLVAIFGSRGVRQNCMTSPWLRATPFF
jgi:hypothetical protein